MSDGRQRRFKPRPGGRSAKVRRKVLEAFVSLVSEGGYETVSIEGVAKAAGVHRSTIHRRWPTLDSLLVDAIMSSAERGWTRPKESKGLRDDLIQTARSARDDLAASAPLMRAINSRAVHNEEVAIFSRFFWARRVRVLIDVVQEAIDRGELPPGADPEAIALALYSPLYMRNLTNQRVSDQLITRLVDVVLEGGLLKSSDDD